MVKKTPKKQLKKYVKFSGMGFQMILTIIVGVYIGKKIDEKFPNPNQIYTVIFSLLFVVLALFSIVKKITKEQNFK